MAARRAGTATKQSTRGARPVKADFSQVAASIVPVELDDEVEKSFLPYAYAVITSRAIPAAEDGLKPVQRRILYSMFDAGYTPDRNHVKSAKVVGNVMGSLHPHGDSAIYEAMVRMAQTYSLTVPLIDGHGNFGSQPGDSPAASRYTEARLSAEALRLLSEVRESCVDMRPNYDSTTVEPALLPAQVPNLLINGAQGIAVGFACKLPTHNPDEVISAARALLADPDLTLDDLMGHIPGPDFPTGATIIGQDGIRDAYETGRGTFRIQSAYTIEPVGRGKHQIVFTELPYEVVIERVIEEIKKRVNEQKLLGVADVKDLTDRLSGTRFVIETKAGINPEALVAELFTLTSLETSYGVNNTVLVGGQPRMLGLKDMLDVFLTFRTETVRRRTEDRLRRRSARAHLIAGLLSAIADIDAVIAIIRAADNADEARTNLVNHLGVDAGQADHVLSLQLRRLTRLDSVELEAERDRLAAEIAALEAILADPDTLRATVDAELVEAGAALSRPRRSHIAGVDLADHVAAAKEASKASVEVADEPTIVSVLTSGDIVRGVRTGRKVDPVVASAPTTTRSRVVLVTNRGKATRVDALHITEGEATRPGLLGVTLDDGERVIAAAPADTDGYGLALATRAGTVKVVTPSWPVRSDEFVVMPVTDGDEIVAGAWVGTADTDLVFVTSDASLLRFDAGKVRPQGLTGGGVAGVKLAPGQEVLTFAAVPHDAVADARVVTWAGGNVKVSPFSLYPAKGRGTGGVRAMKFLKGADRLAGAWVGANPVAGIGGKKHPLPDVDPRRDGSGTRVDTLPEAVGF